MNHTDLAELLKYPDQSIAVIAHDAGSASLLLRSLQPLAKQLRFCVKGPAQQIVSEQWPNHEIYETPQQCLKGCKLLLSGTSWASKLEHEGRLIAASNHIYSVGVLDHWVNYKQRFEFDQQHIMPDELWVFDHEALILARQTFPNQKIKIYRNEWLAQTVENIIKIKRLNLNSPSSINLLYLLEPLRDHSSGKPNRNEFKVLDFWLRKLPNLINSKAISNCYSEVNIALRPHPSDPAGKYDDWINKHSKEWRMGIDPNARLEESLAWADAVFGCETQALVVALACKIPTFCTLPSSEPACRLPHGQLRHLSKEI